MASTISNRVDGNKATLALSGRFDFSIHRDFRKNYEEILGSNQVRELDVDLGKVEYIDSSALGMLLLLREKAGGQNIRLRLANTQGAVRQVLEVANFSRLFDIS